MNRVLKEINKSEQTLQERFIAELQKNKYTVAIYLTNGIKLVGKIEAFDKYVILLGSVAQQIIYKHAISTVQITSETPVEIKV